MEIVEVIPMGEDDYRKALEAAEKELAELERKADVVAQRRAQLQQTIGALKTLMNISEQEERTITDTIRIAVRAANGYVKPDEVLKNVLAMGVKFSSKNAIASVTTILSRLHRDGELLHDPLLGYKSVPRAPKPPNWKK
jgi:multidrug resistance efflux pump